ncbi:MAG TPA: hypothetical protein VMH39_17640, partial [Gemmatimonadaceae bacterium]|nr:hypothetical protein [Gemmatimonadaceae bacterium]
MPHNALVEATFGVRNDYVPGPITPAMSLTFRHAYGDRVTTPTLLGAVVVPRPVVTAGLGITRQVPDLSLIQGLTRSTGLPSGERRIQCESSATPLPDWGAVLSDPAAIPDACADGSAGSVFASGVPNVQVIDPRYQSPLRATGSLGWRRPVLTGRFATSITGTYAGARYLQDPVDLNFDPTPRFTLPGEAGRPVFAHVDGIDPTTGVIAADDARVSGAFGSVLSTRSTLRSDAVLLSAAIYPTVSNGPVRWSASYAWQAGRRLSDGFVGSTAGDPFQREWVRIPAATHQLRFTPRYLWLGAADLSLSLALSSGVPFTPRIDRDVNGDGLANDRPFVFNPATAGDSVLAQGMSSLLSRGARPARECLRRQLGQIAGAASCETGWSLQATALNATLVPWRFPMLRRSHVLLSLANPIGALDLIVHGGHEAGWGQPSLPETVLLQVAGFDSAAHRFRYEVNPDFG